MQASESDGKHRKRTYPSGCRWWFSGMRASSAFPGRFWMVYGLLLHCHWRWLGSFSFPQFEGHLKERDIIHRITKSFCLLFITVCLEWCLSSIKTCLDPISSSKWAESYISAERSLETCFKIPSTRTVSIYAGWTNDASVGVEHWTWIYLWIPTPHQQQILFRRLLLEERKQ